MDIEGYDELLELGTFSKTDIARLLHIDKSTLCHALAGRRDWKQYEHATCRILAIRARAVLRKLDEMGHGDK